MDTAALAAPDEVPPSLMAWAAICNPCSFPSFLSSLRNDKQRQRPQADRSAGAPGRSPGCQGLVRKTAATKTWLCLGTMQEQPVSANTASRHIPGKSVQWDGSFWVHP